MKPKLTQALVIFLFALANSCGFAAPSLTIGNSPGYPGTTVSLPIYLNQASNVLVADFQVSFNTIKVSQIGPPLSSRNTALRVKSRNIEPGLHRVIAYSISRNVPTATNRLLATLPFTLSPNEYNSSGSITPINAVLVQQDETLFSPLALNPGTIFARPVHINSDGTAAFFLRSQPGVTYDIQASADLQQWTNITVKTAASDFLDVIDPFAPNYRQRFYKAVPAN